MDDLELLQRMTIKNATNEHIQAILEISDQELGQGYMDKQTIEDAIQDDNSYLKIAEIDNKVNGFCYGFISNLENRYTKRDLDILLQAFSSASSVGMIKTVITKRDVQRKGVGTKMVDDCLEFFKEKNAQHAYSVAWKRHGIINIEKVLKRLNFEELKEIEDFWAFDSIEHGYSCPACGTPPCRCSAIIFVKYNLNKEQSN